MVKGVSTLSAKGSLLIYFSSVLFDPVIQISRASQSQANFCLRFRCVCVCMSVSVCVHVWVRACLLTCLVMSMILVFNSVPFACYFCDESLHGHPSLLESRSRSCLLFHIHSILLPWLCVIVGIIFLYSGQLANNASWQLKSPSQIKEAVQGARCHISMSLLLVIVVETRDASIQHFLSLSLFRYQVYQLGMSPFWFYI